MTKTKIGFIGLGLMGSAMAERLLGLGYPLQVLGHKKRAAIDRLVARGATEASSAAELTAAVEFVFLCMDTSASVEARMEGEDGVLATIKPGQVVVDFGTSEPGSTRELAAQAAKRGAHFVDAPLGRTPSHAREGKLNIMFGGPDAVFAALKPILAELSENLFHVGPVGAGHTLKLINNFFGMTIASAMSEAFAIADLAGLKRDKLYEVMSAGPLRSGMMDFIKAQAVDRENKLAFSIANALKDVGYYAEMAADLGVPSLMSSDTRQAFGIANAEGWGDRMVPEMVDFFTEMYAKTKH